MQLQRLRMQSKIRKVPSSLSFSTDVSSYSLQKLMLQAQKNDADFKGLSMEHFFEQFSFEHENPAKLAEIKKRFAEHPDHLKFDLSEEPSYKETQEAIIAGLNTD
jgi:hypothetical protein